MNFLKKIIYVGFFLAIFHAQADNLQTPAAPKLLLPGDTSNKPGVRICQGKSCTKIKGGAYKVQDGGTSGKKPGQGAPPTVKYYSKGRVSDKPFSDGPSVKVEPSKANPGGAQSAPSFDMSSTDGKALSEADLQKAMGEAYAQDNSSKNTFMDNNKPDKRMPEAEGHHERSENRHATNNQ